MGSVRFDGIVCVLWLLCSAVDNQMKWYDDTNVQYSNWRNGRPDIEGDFMAGLNPDGVWELITYRPYFADFQQRSIVACKLDNGQWALLLCKLVFLILTVYLFCKHFIFQHLQHQLNIFFTFTYLFAPPL